MTYTSDLAVGGVLATQAITPPDEYFYNCNQQGDTAVTTGSSYSGAAVDSSGIMATNVAGVGVKLTWSMYRDVFTVPFTYSAYWPAPGSWGYRGAASSLVMSFIKTGPITGGTINSGNYFGYKLNDGNWFSIFRVTSNISLKRVGCTVSNTIINVPMGGYSRASFSGIGPSAISKSFSIPLSCIAGTQVSMTIAGTADASAVTGVLALNASTSPPAATGVGLQVLFGGNPITLGTAFIANASAPDGTLNIPMTARYYQTAAQVTPGPANSTATFTMTYN